MSSLNSSLRCKPELSVRMVVCDHYLTKPVPAIDVVYSEFRGADIKQVPVLRIFGPASDGHKTCLHVHGVFPYFYIPCPTPSPDPSFLYQIAASLDKALNIALKQANSTHQHVYKIALVKGLPFYGFHDKEHLYLKVFLYSPNLIKQAVELCSNGSILGQIFQPHESHLNFTLQFFIDFNLFGMSNIDLQSVKFRRSGLSQSSTEPINSSSDINLKPESICYYEVDCIAYHILNRLRIGKGDGIENPGLQEVWNQEIERRKQLNISFASKSLSQGRIQLQETNSHYKYKKIFTEKMSNPLQQTVHNLDSKKFDEIHYPAESEDGSQLFSAVDLNMHLPEMTMCSNYGDNNESEINCNETLISNGHNTIVNDTVKMNSNHSLHYSQVILDDDDLELVDMLQDMDQRIIEEDSILKTPAQADVSIDAESDDEEYSQVFNEDTILMEPYKGDENTNTTVWNDSFWEGANIPQLDGTSDDDHVKKVRKRKMRSFKLGLSRPKSKKSSSTRNVNEVKESNINESVIDETDISMEASDSISKAHLQKSVKLETPTTSDNNNIKEIPSQLQIENQSITDLVEKITIKHEHEHIDAAEIYDLKNHNKVIAGPSRTNKIEGDDKVCDYSISNSYDSSPEDNKGIISFYNKSKLFDESIEDGTMSNTNMFIADKDLKEQYKNVTNKNSATLDKRVYTVIAPKIRPPTNKHIISSLKQYDIKKHKHIEPYFSDYRDVGHKVEIGQMVLKLRSNVAKDQKPFEKILDTTNIEEWRQLLFLQTNDMCEMASKTEPLKLLLAGNRKCVLQPIKMPPTKYETLKWISNRANNTILEERNILSQKELSKNVDDLDNSQAIGLHDDEINNISLEITDKEKTDVNNSLQVTMQQDGSYLCFGGSDSQNNTAVEASLVEANFLTVMLIEIHTSVRGEFNPNPLIDSIQAVFIEITNDCPSDHCLPKTLSNVLVVDDKCKLLDRCVFNANVSYVNNENEIFEKVIQMIKIHDPDIMCGFEIEMNSWGYFFERSQVLGIDIVKEVSRITEKHRQKRWRSEENDYEGRIIGRIIFNVWRLFRHELALSSYSFENCMFEILKERVPYYSYAQLSAWWNDESRILRWIPVEYYLTKLSGTVRMLEKLDIIKRTSELARLFGLQWWEVVSRGSQLRVESLMIRAGRPLNLVALSPTVRQRAAMRAPECLPLIFEPESRFYSDPVIVLDFQSLYPSMMIAYNYCFSTCIGRVENITDAAYEFGAWRLRIPKSKLEALAKNNLIHWSPVGVGFVKSSVRRGVLPALLRRILAARQAVKKSMKLQTDETVKKAMHSRQLGLKLIANVTYGYTAANFSGRMPCVEVGDSVVAKGRETLERAIKLVSENKQWNAKVVYGDTDSMFVLIPGGTRAMAFDIGQQIADAVTADNPSPVALKLEKVYQPCILQTKKRYVGYMYESADQEQPIYEAKGIETVRRDGCPAGVKVLKRALCELFDTGDMSRVKRVVQSCLSRLADGSLPIHELFFTREYHGPGGYRPGATAPPNEIAKRLRARDARSAPPSGWRVSWAVAAGGAGEPLWRLARSPRDLAVSRAPPHRSYYASRVLLPPLHRCLSLLGVDVYSWWTELGYTRDIQMDSGMCGGGGITRYLWRQRCAVCGARGARALCTRCAPAPASAAALLARLSTSQTHLHYCNQICTSCCGHVHPQQCENVECPVFWRRLTAHDKLSQLRDVFAHLPSQFTQISLDF